MWSRACGRAPRESEPWRFGARARRGVGGGGRRLRCSGRVRRPPVASSGVRDRLRPSRQGLPVGPGLRRGDRTPRRRCAGGRGRPRARRCVAARATRASRRSGRALPRGTGVGRSGQRRGQGPDRAERVRARRPGGRLRLRIPVGAHRGGDGAGDGRGPRGPRARHRSARADGVRGRCNPVRARGRRGAVSPAVRTGASTSSAACSWESSPRSVCALSISVWKGTRVSAARPARGRGTR